MRVRQMELRDLEAVLAVERRSFTTPWSRKAFEQELQDNPAAHYFVLESAPKIIGYFGMWRILDEGHITNIAIDPDYRGKGYSHLLLQEVFDRMEAEGVRYFTLEVRASNQVAIHLYERYGFERAGVRKGYYRDTGEDALLMWRR